MRIRRPIGRRPIDGRPGIGTFNSTPFPRGPIQQSGTFNSTPFPRGPIQQQPIQIQPGFAVDPIRQPVGMGPLPNNFGPMQGVGDPRLGAPMIPGNQAQMMMRGTTQAAPVQPVTAMKKGGVVRGGRAEIKGTRPCKIT